MTIKGKVSDHKAARSLWTRVKSIAELLEPPKIDSTATSFKIENPFIDDYKWSGSELIDEMEEVEQIQNFIKLINTYLIDKL